MSVSLTNIITEKLHKDGSFKKKLVGQSKTILLQRLTFVQSKRDSQSHTKSLSKKYQTLNQMSNSRSTSSEKGITFNTASCMPSIDFGYASLFIFQTKALIYVKKGQILKLCYTILQN